MKERKKSWSPLSVGRVGLSVPLSGRSDQPGLRIEYLGLQRRLGGPAGIDTYLALSRPPRPARVGRAGLAGRQSAVVTLPCVGRSKGACTEQSSTKSRGIGASGRLRLSCAPHFVTLPRSSRLKLGARRPSHAAGPPWPISRIFFITSQCCCGNCLKFHLLLRVTTLRRCVATDLVRVSEPHAEHLCNKSFFGAAGFYFIYFMKARLCFGTI